jgi:hypothetical protein
VASEPQQPRPPRLHLVDWHRASTGLWLPRSGDNPTRYALQVGSSPAGEPVLAPLTRLPSAFEQVGVFVDEHALGIEPLSPSDVEALMRHVGFEPAVWGLAAVLRTIDNLDRTPAAQLALARKIYADDNVVALIASALNAGRGDVVLAEQQVVALTRLAILVARPLQLSDSADANGAALERALLASGSLVLSDHERLTGDPPDELELTSTLLQIGAFCAREPLAEALGRTAYLFGDRARSPAAKARHDYVDLAALGPDVETQVALGLAALGHTGALSGSLEDFRPGVLAPDWVEVVADAVGIPAAEVAAMLTADRDWFATTFRAIETTLDLSAEAARAGWNRVPFEMRPFLRLTNGQLLLWSPGALTAWMTDGVYHRFHDAAKSVGRGEDLRTFYGWLVEEYVREVLREAHPGPRPAGGGRVLDEVTYTTQHGEGRSPDAAIDLGPDLVLFEVASGRLTLPTRVTGTAETVFGNLNNLVLGKARQLSRRIDDFLAGRLVYPDLAAEHVERIWPVLVTGTGLLMNEALANRIRDDLGQHLRQPRVQYLTILDLADVEQLCALVEQGHSVAEVLRHKLGGYAELDFRRMVHDDPHFDHCARSAGSEQRIRNAFAMVGERFGWDRAQMHAALDERR